MAMGDSRMTRPMPGILAIIGLVVAIFLGWGSGFAIYWRLAYVLLLAVVVGMAWSWLNLWRIELTLDRRATRGQVGVPLEGRIRVHNRSRLPRPWLEVEELTDLPDPHAGRVVNLSSRDTRSWRHIVECNRRGVFTLGPVRVTSGDPFGLFRAKRDFLGQQRIVVYPRAEPLPNLNLPYSGLPGDGRRSERSQHATTQAATIRPYVQGDSVNRVHWPSTARMGKLMIKEFDQGISASVWLLLDMQRGAQAGENFDNTEELTVSIAASVATQLLRVGVPVGMAAYGDHPYLLRPDHGIGQGERLLELLALVRAQGRRPLGQAILSIEPSLTRLDTLVLITPNAAADWLSSVEAVRGRGIRMVSILVDPSDFGGSGNIASVMEQLFAHDIPTYMVNRGQSLSQALTAPLNARRFDIPVRVDLELRV